MKTYAEQLAEVENYREPKAPTADQRSPEWLAERIGHVTASRFANVLDITKKGTESAKRRNYKVDVLVERLTGQPTEHYVSLPMQAGIDNEPMARMAYEAATGAIVEQVGFIHHPTIKWVGGSPDGLVGADGGVELKCPQPAEHIRILLTKDIADYQAQIQGLMWIKARQWWDFVSYCPQMPDGLQVYIQRVPRDDDYIAELAGNVLQFLAEVDEQHKALMAIARANESAAPQEQPAVGSPPADSLAAVADIGTQI